MLKTCLIVTLLAFSLSLISGAITIPLLKKLKIGQPILKYVEIHKDKSGTPTMGGLFFIVPTVVMFFLFGGSKGKIAVFTVAIGLAYMIVGFIDDFIKVKFKQNEGLKAYQKVVFQFLIALTAGIFAFVNGITKFNLPFSLRFIDLGVLTIPIITIIFIAVTNSVNLTDGLDGLAGSTCATYLFFITVIIILQSSSVPLEHLEGEEYYAITMLSSALFGGVIGFLIFNTNTAKVFMGDTGSLSLGGFIGAISIFTFNSFFIPLLGITFALSSISVILQVVHYKRTKKRIFLMTPLHHHFQLKGFTESQIAYLYSFVTAIFGSVLLFVYL